jgi:phage-related tail fiber protein
MPRSVGTTNVAKAASAPPVGYAGDTYLNTTESRLYVVVAGVWVPWMNAYDPAWKEPARVASTANLAARSGLLTIDGVTVAAGDRVLVRAQTAPAENGVYVAAAGTWARANDCATAARLVGAAVVVREGATLANTVWQQTTDPPITLGTSSIVWAVLGGGSAEVDVSTGGPAPRVAQLLWVDTDDAGGVVGQRWSQVFVSDSGPNILANNQAVAATITHNLGASGIVVGQLEDGSWAHQFAWRTSINTATQVQITFLNHGPNTGQALLRFRMLY